MPPGVVSCTTPAVPGSGSAAAAAAANTALPRETSSTFSDVACVLLKLGEIVLRGRNRWRFYAQLQRNVKRAFRDVGPLELRQRGGVLAVLAPDEHADALLARARDVIGVNVVHPARVLEKTPEAAAAAAIQLLRDRPGRTFAVRARRRDKQWALTSHELAALVGRAVQDELDLDVDLDEPDLEIHLEVDRSEIFAYTEKLPGPGGLPVGTSGRALVLLSGGIDSPVAAFRVMKRGLRCDFVHFSGRPFTGPESIYKAYAQVARLDRFQGGSRLFVVPFGHAQRELATARAGRLQVLAQRRLMVHVAAALAEREDAQALVTGDALGQVSSQTLHNLAVVEEASPLPLLRPLLAWDKSEIVREAESLGTLDVSTLPADDCCTLFASPLAETRADRRKLQRVEGLVELPALVPRLVASAELVRPGSPRRTAETAERV
ncbi:MAG: tRNA 4-thiouridine(8) synthase ThiI [Thermoleophilia bacterium]|nr:tRNA 4-thiouridine(8) synthase ThiI [Thermoleophilia bacterium]